jgi:hypothetical protein
MGVDLPPEALPFLGLVAALAATAVFLILGLSGSARCLRKVEPAFEPGSARLCGVLSRWLEGRSLGFQFRYRLQPATSNSAGAALLTARVVAPFDWKAAEVGHGPQVVNLGTLALVQLGILRDVDIGDPELDRRLRFATVNEMDLVVAFGGQPPRTALQRLVDTANFRGITIHKGRCRIQWAPRDASLDESPEVVRDRLGRTVNLLTALGISPGSLG